MKLDPADVARRVKEWFDVFLLGDQWQFTVDVVDSLEDAQESTDAYAFVRVSAGIFHAAFTFNAWQIEDEVRLDRVVCHEVLHVVLWQQEAALKRVTTKEIAKAHSEQLVERLSRALSSLKEAAMDGLPVAEDARA